MASHNKIQYTDSPWAYSLDRLRYEELYDISSEMQDAIDKELYTYVFDILTCYLMKNYPQLIPLILL